MDRWLFIKSVVFTFEIGKAWLFITFISVILICVLLAKNLETNKKLTIWAIFLTLLMLLGYGRSSHAATITEWQGFVFHTLHFLAVTVWIGILLVISWFSKNKNNWLNFLKWFTPIAITCLIITIVAGYFTMEIDIDSYDDPNASVIQELMELESVYALIVFGLTAFMGQSWPPHQIYLLINTEGASPLFETLYSGDIVNTIQNAENFEVFNVIISFGMDSYLLFGLAILFMILTIFAAIIRKSVFVSTFSSLLMVVSIYFGIMFGVQ
ncbi:hypothetical protein RhiirA1_481147 [Rhizophagus irregularis]|uniref:Uncharacterized protein n=1 Tax=Rhizophagus irregularis TaxID=588596 RepID=A0A2N0QNH6_9GLOM|nr:hypothetical protein RhiirA1_481147 [Rhizophagus irregularis]